MNARWMWIIAGSGIVVFLLAFYFGGLSRMGQ
jgi:hypothetical protein